MGSNQCMHHTHLHNIDNSTVSDRIIFYYEKIKKKYNILFWREKNFMLLKFRKILNDEYAAMIGLPLRMIIGSIVLACFIGIPKILNMFGVSHPFIDFMVMPVMAFFMFVLVFSIYLATIVLNPARFIIIMPCILVISLVLTWALFIAN